MPISLNDINIKSFREIFKRIVKDKESSGISAIQNNPTDLFERAKSYGHRYVNGSWTWSSNIWSRSAPNSVQINREDKLQPEHRQLMLNVLEHILCRPLIQVDANLGSPGSKAEMKCRLYCDPQFPDIAYRWSRLNFPGDPECEPDVEIFCIPHYLENPNVPDSDDMLRVIRFPNSNYSIITVSSYQGECKKGFLSHWILHAYRKGGTGEHAALKEFTVRKTDGTEKRIAACFWGLTGSGKSTHGMYAVDEYNIPIFKEKFGIDVSEFVYDQAFKNDDIVAVFEDQVVSPEIGAWTKTEGVDKSQIGIYQAAMASRALHENTEWDAQGNPSFEGKILQYRGKLNRNARTVLMMEDTGYFDGSVDSSVPLNMAVFITPGYLTDFAWVKLNDTDFAAKVLADGRTVGHPAQSAKGVGKEKYASRYCSPFTMGVGNAAHVHRFRGFVQKREGTDNPIETYLINTTGKVGTEYTWEEADRDGKKVNIAQPVFEERDGKRKPVGGTGPSIEETELFLFQAARGTVEYQSHPVWGDKVLIPVRVPGLSEERLQELNPFTYHDLEEMKRLLHVQIETSKYYLDGQCPGLDKCIYDAMDF